MSDSARREARHQLTVDGGTRWFCCEGCLEEFQRAHSTAAGR